jgi:alkaline phosphatase
MSRSPAGGILRRTHTATGRVTDNMRRLLIALLLAPVALSAQPLAKNVILFLADAGGLSTLAAASLHGYGAPRRLYIQRMPHIGLSDTSTATQIVTDSAAGMTAIVTGEKTLNGVISQSATAVRKKADGAPLKSILEHAEERGLATGVITNDAVTGATPAATYAKANDRGLTAVIFQQLFKPRFGDGVDVMIGGGLGAITSALTEAGLSLEALSAQAGRPLLRTFSDIPEDATRALVVLDSGEFDLQTAMDRAIRMLSRNPRGYFLMVEWDTHTDRIRRGLDRVVTLDRAIERTAKTAGPDTLLLFTADHSFDLRLRGGTFGGDFLEGLEAAEAESPKGPLRIPTLRMDNGHTGEEVLAAAQGPGAERVRGYMANTDLFRVMMAAYGWEPFAAGAPGGR